MTSTLAMCQCYPCRIHRWYARQYKAKKYGWKIHGERPINLTPGFHCDCENCFLGKLRRLKYEERRETRMCLTLSKRISNTPVSMKVQQVSGGGQHTLQ